MSERPGMTDEDEVFMPGKQKIKIHRIKDRYDKLSEIYNLSELINDLYERRYLNAPADRLCQRYDYNVVVFSHTHNATIDKYYFLVEDRIYANSGSWCKKNAYAVEIDKSLDPEEPVQVFLHKVDKKGEIEDTKQEEV